MPLLRTIALISLLTLLSACGKTDEQTAAPLLSAPTEQHNHHYYLAVLADGHGSPFIAIDRSTFPADRFRYRLSLQQLPYHRSLITPVTFDPNFSTTLIDATRTHFTVLYSFTGIPFRQSSHAAVVTIQRTDKTGWRAPAFTPDVAEAATRESLRRAKLSESMADDAYYFGYSANDDALE